MRADIRHEIRACQAAIDEVRHLHLSGHSYSLVARIVDALTRAGLLVQDGDAP